jgi:hypothetical protein
MIRDTAIRIVPTRAAAPPVAVSAEAVIARAAPAQPPRMDRTRDGDARARG